MADNKGDYEECRYVVTLRTVNVPTGNSPDRRLAMLLKAALRTYGFKCISVKEVKDGDDSNS